MSSDRRSMVINIAANVEELKKRLAEGGQMIHVTTSAMRKLASSLDGNKLLQNAHNIVAAVNEVGGATKLTDSEKQRLNATLTRALEKYKALGKEAPEAMVKLHKETTVQAGLFDNIRAKLGGLGPMLAATFTLGAVVAAGKKVLDFAGKVSDLSARLGMSTTAVQKFELAFSPAGISLDTVARSAAELANRIAGGDKGAVGALQRLGLSAETLMGMSMEDMFITVADAVGGMQNKAEQIYASKTLFGKGGVELLSGLNGKLRETTDSFEAMGVILDEQTVAAADSFGDQLGVLSKVGTALLANVLAPALPGLASMAQWLMGAASSAIHFAQGLEGSLIKALMQASIWWNQFLLAIAEGTQKIPLLGKYIGVSAETVNYLRENVQVAKDRLALFSTEVTRVAETSSKRLTPAMVDLGTANDDVAKATDKAADAVLAYKGQLHAAVPPAIKAAETTRDVADALDEMGYALHRGEIVLKSFNKFVPMATLDLNRFENALYRLPGAIGSQRVSEEVESVEQEMGALSAAFHKSIGDINNIFQAAFEGGGGVGGAIKSGVTNAIKEFGKLIPGVGPIISGMAGAIVAGASKIGSAIKGLFGGGEHSKVNDLRDKFIEAAGGLHALNVKAHEAGTNLDALLRAKKVKDFEAAVADLNKKMGDFANSQAADAARLEEAIRKYGFAFEELGPKFQAQQLHEKAVELIEDWRVLVDSGIDVARVNDRMSGAVNEYLQRALRVGAEVPLAMKPILESFARQGLLVDENGNKITDLGAAGITWSESMREGFDRVVSKLQELLDRLQDAGSAIADIPDSVDVEVNIDVPEIPPISIPFDFPTPWPDLPGGWQLPPGFQLPDVVTGGGSGGGDRDGYWSLEGVSDEDKARFLASNPGDDERMAMALGHWVPMAEGGAGVVTRPTVFLAGEAGPEPFWFGGANGRGPEAPGSADMRGVEDRLDRVERHLRDIPRAMKIAMQDARVLGV